uniref:DUF4371 domain-containing protein n=1 Tax=Aegilops tauschii subsp. strangulata TaxID=200361 RepID=A0A453HXG2_AEGTS
EDVRKVVIQNAPNNCKWVCPDIQKELVSYFAKVNNNHHYSLLYIYFMQFILTYIVVSNQNGTFSCFSQITLDSILEEIGADVFSLLIDEASDVSDKEQMVVVLRYVDKLGLILEHLVGVVHVSETSATCLKSALEKLLANIGLSFKQVRGHCYDGASNMGGEFNGLKAKFLEENRSAYYVHCFSHQLQLVIVAISKKNKDIADFFYMISLMFNVVGAS